MDERAAIPAYSVKSLESGSTSEAMLVEQGVEPARRLDLRDVAAIGRDPACSLRIDDPLVSGRHAEVRRTVDGKYEIVDLGSRRGTFVRGRRVSTAVLEDGDEILVGPARFRFEDGGVQRRNTRKALRRTSDVAANAAIELTAALEKAATLRELLEALLRTSLDIVEGERGAALLVGEGEPHPTLQIGMTRDGAPAHVPLSSSLLSEVAARRAGVLSANVGEDPLLNEAASLAAQQVRSAMCVPLIHHGDQLGVLHLDSRLGGAFTAGNLELVTAMARQASVAIRNAVLVEKVASATQAERARLHGVLDDLPDGVALVDGDGRIAFANARAPALLALLGAVDGAVPERLGSVTVGDLLGAGEPVEVSVQGPSPRVLRLSAHATSGDGAACVLVLRDVTRDREREARLAQQERLAVVGQLAAGIAHDFNNLLAIVTSFSQFVLDEVTAPRQREDLQQVLDAAMRASELVRQLLAVGRCNDAARPRVVRLETLVGSMRKLVRGAVGENIDLVVDFAPDLWRVKVDPSMFGQVVLNLAVNARDAMCEGGTLTVRARNEELGAEAAAAASLPPGRYTVLEVADTGSGMPDPVAAKVFEPFFTTKPAGKGTGLGLATALGIIQQAGGTITLRTKEGEGTTFRVLLPATDEKEGHFDVPDVRPEGGRETVLVVEDERLVRELTRRILSDAGYTVLDASNGAEAIRVAAAHGSDIHLLLTDVVMPGMSGRQLARQLVESRPALRVLYTSAYFDEMVGGGAEADVVAKPFQRETLLQRVRLALTR